MMQSIRDWCNNIVTRENHVRQIVIIVVAAGLIGYDLVALNGYYLRMIFAEAASLWHAVETFFLGLF